MTDIASDNDETAAAYCADLVRSHDFKRYASTIFVAPELRRPLLALYAFNVEITRVREQVSQALPGEIRLQWWTDLLAGQAHGSAEANPVAAELIRAIRADDLPVARLSRLIEEHQFDVYNDPMPTMAALEGYLSDTSATLYALAARICGEPQSHDIDHLARHAGLAEGLVQVVSRIGYDASRRQLFLPQQVLAQHGSDASEVFTGKLTPRIRSAIEQVLAGARQHLAAAQAMIADLPGEVKRAFLPLALVRRDLTRLATADVDPFAMRPSSRLSVLWTVWRASRSRQFGA